MVFFSTFDGLPTAGKEAQKMELKHHKDRSPQRKAAQTEIVKTVVTMVLLSLVAGASIAAYLSTAWFINNSQVDAQDQSVSADPVELYADSCWLLNYYMKTVTDENGNQAQEEDFECLAEQDVSAIAMMPYDAIFKYNEHTPLVICLAVKGTDVSSGKPFYVNLSTDDQAWATDNTMNRLLSNILQVQCFALKTDTPTASNGETVWADVVTASETAAAQSFLTFQDGTGGKTDSLTFLVKDYSNAVQSTDAGDTLFVYLVLDYNRDLIQKYMDENKVTVRVSQENSDHNFATDLAAIKLTQATDEAQDSQEG
jgi:hypothetical protein